MKLIEICKMISSLKIRSEHLIVMFFEQLQNEIGKFIDEEKVLMERDGDKFYGNVPFATISDRMNLMIPYIMDAVTIEDLAEKNFFDPKYFHAYSYIISILKFDNVNEKYENFVFENINDICVLSASLFYFDCMEKNRLELLTSRLCREKSIEEIYKFCKITLRSNAYGDDLKDILLQNIDFCLEKFFGEIYFNDNQSAFEEKVFSKIMDSKEDHKIIKLYEKCCQMSDGYSRKRNYQSESLLCQCIFKINAMYYKKPNRDFIYQLIKKSSKLEYDHYPINSDDYGNYKVRKAKFKSRFNVSYMEADDHHSKRFRKFLKESFRKDDEIAIEIFNSIHFFLNIKKSRDLIFEFIRDKKMYNLISHIYEFESSVYEGNSFELEDVLKESKKHFIRYSLFNLLYFPKKISQERKEYFISQFDGINFGFIKDSEVKESLNDREFLSFMLRLIGKDGFNF